MTYKMFFKQSAFLLLLFWFITTNTYSQGGEKWILRPLDSVALSLVDYEQNILKNTSALSPFFTKLNQLKNGSNENVVVVHIGDSHIQADLLSGVVRNEFQHFFGNAGRGLVFPYQVVKTNGPFDLNSSSKSDWKWNRLARSRSVPYCGISGFGMHSQCAHPEFSLRFKNDTGNAVAFDKITLFTNEDLCELVMDYNEGQQERLSFDSPTACVSAHLKTVTSGISISFPANDSIRFYGASLEKLNSPGVLYHSIGVNGARYSDFNKTTLFWKQLPYLKADCYIVSLGTNEAQVQGMTTDEFWLELDQMVEHIRQVSPKASIVLTTPPISYFMKIKPNVKLCDMVKLITDYSIKNHLAYWDLFTISKGLEGAKRWSEKKYLRSDLVHFSKEGYALQGSLLAEAFAKSWNEFLTTQ